MIHKLLETILESSGCLQPIPLSAPPGRRKLFRGSCRKGGREFWRGEILIEAEEMAARAERETAARATKRAESTKWRVGLKYLRQSP
jgi:hypothetical protein